MLSISRSTTQLDTLTKCNSNETKEEEKKQIDILQSSIPYLQKGWIGRRISRTPSVPPSKRRKSCSEHKNHQEKFSERGERYMLEDSWREETEKSKERGAKNLPRRRAATSCSNTWGTAAQALLRDEEQRETSRVDPCTAIHLTRPDPAPWSREKPGLCVDPTKPGFFSHNFVIYRKYGDCFP